MGKLIDAGFWSRVLGEKGLESPGREEAVKAAIAWTQQKKMNKEESAKEKSKNRNKKK
jgi:hypothetical protein